MQFTKCGTGPGLMVNIFSRSNHARSRSRLFPLEQGSQCLIDSGVFTAAQVEAMKQKIETSGPDTED